MNKICLILLLMLTTLLANDDGYSQEAINVKFSANSLKLKNSRDLTPSNNNIARQTKGSNEKSPLLTSLDAPINDSCQHAEFITGPYPVTGSGTTIDATEDCGQLMPWQIVWYAIELPYEYNDITIAICGLNGDLQDAGAALMIDCECSSYSRLPTVTFLDPGQCFTAYSGIEFIYSSIPDNINDEGIIYCPTYVYNYQNENMDFYYHIDIVQGTAPPPGDQCSSPILIESLPYNDNQNSCDFNNDYNFSGQDIVYQLNIDTCLIVDISLCATQPVFDTYLLIYEEGDCGGIPIAYDDDFCMPPQQFGTSRIIDTLDAGLYYILVDAYGGNCGDYILDITTEYCPVYGACCFDTACVGTMIEDDCMNLQGTWYANDDCEQGFMCPGSCFQYLVGDANMLNGQWPPLIIGGDVTFLVSYFRGISRPCLLNGFFCSADANGDCIIIGSDVTRLVNYFRGNANLGYCPECLPCWISSDDLPETSPPGWPNCD